MTVETFEELEGLKKIGQIVGLTLQTMLRAAKPGMTTRELDEIGQEFLARHGARSAPQLTYNFPGATCISINDVAAHGIPGDTVLHPGDMLNIDVSAELDGFYADTGATLPLPPVNPSNQKLCEAARAALWKAIHSVKAGERLNAIGQAVEHEAQRRGFGLIRELTGHGVGRGLHEDPESILNYFEPRDGRIQREGWVLAIEPFLTDGKGRIYEDRDGWSLRTLDRKCFAQYEHTVVVTQGKPVIITAV